MNYPNVSHPVGRTLACLALLLLSCLSPAAHAALTVSPIFRANMVLQRSMPVPVFGTSDPGAQVTVTFNGQSVSTTAAANGAWRINLAAMPARNTPDTLSVIGGGASVAYTGVQVGEVWLCSGQSNMGRPLSSADGSAPYIADAPNHNIRLFRMTAGNGPATASWTTADATTAANFSAVGYWMGLDLSYSLNVPIGLIQATHDGTGIDHWQHTNGGSGDDYDAMVKSIQPFAIRGVAWYQGESNGGDAAYQTKLTDMIAEWRADWQLPALPFGIVQLTAQKWTAARLAQFNVSRTVANTFLVVTHDLPNGSQLHPTAKYLVGMRCSIGARGSIYGENIVYSGPVLAGPPATFVSGTSVTLKYLSTGSSLFTGNSGAPTPYTVSTGGRAKSATGLITAPDTVQLTTNTAGITRVQYGVSSLGNLFASVLIPVEGGAKTVDRLPASLFDLPVQ